MELTALTPDQVVLWQWGPFTLNATILYTWLVMAVLTLGSWVVTRRLSSETPESRWQNLLEIIVDNMREQIREISREQPEDYVPFIGTLFLFIAVSNVFSILPGVHSPTGSLSTTTALAACVFVAVPLYGISREGIAAYLRHYITPTPFMLPFHVLGELSRTIALAVRLFGNVMSGTKIVAILLAIAPLFFPVAMQALGLLIGLIQAYIFAILAMVYIGSASRAHRERGIPNQTPQPTQGDDEHG